MENVWTLAALWVGLALVATLLAIWFKISTALTEIVVGTVAQLIIGAFIILRSKSFTGRKPIKSISSSWVAAVNHCLQNFFLAPFRNASCAMRIVP
jgi:hypothetical protein